MDRLLERRQIVLVAGVLDVRLQLCMPANQIHPSAKQVAGRPHRFRIRVGLWERATAQKLSDLLAVDPIVLHLPAMDGFHVQGVTQDERDAQLRAEVGDPVPDEHHACVQVDPAVVFVTIFVETHLQPPPRNEVLMSDSGLSHCTSARGRP